MRRWRIWLLWAAAIIRVRRQGPAPRYQCANSRRCVETVSPAMISQPNSGRTAAADGGSPCRPTAARHRT